MREFSQTPVFETGNARILGKDFRDVTQGLRAAGPVGDGTILLRFRNYHKQGYMALFTVLTDQYPASYLTAYSKHANQVGFLKTLVSEDRCMTKTLDIRADLPVDFGFVNTMALTAKRGEGYALYYNGERVRTVYDPDAALLADLLALGPVDRAMLGDFLEPQKMLERHYPFCGDIDFIRLYDTVLPEEWLLEFTGQSKLRHEALVPAGTCCSVPIRLYGQGLWGSRGYRIPTLLRTKGGTLLAFIDQRFFGGADHPNRIHTVLRRSGDGGETWGEPITALAMPGNAQTIDTCSVQDAETGRIFLITDAFPEALTTFTAQSGTGWRKENGEQCRILVNGPEEYLSHPDGRITRDGADTGMLLGPGDQLYGAAGEDLGNIWTEHAFLRLYPTSHLLLLASDDDGASWSVLRDLNLETKEAWMRFYGCGPGAGIQLKSGPRRGRLVLPVYFFNRQNRQAAALIYSDDHGATWHRGAAPVDGWRVDGKTLCSETLDEGAYETLEGQPVELPDGTLLYYMRNGRRMALGAYSRDGGETWAAEENFYDEALTGPCGQFGIAHWDGLIDGREAYACSIHLDGANVGTVKLGLAEEIPPTPGGRRCRIVWRYSKTVWEGPYYYSSICCLLPDRAAIFFESSSSASMTFQKMDLAFLKAADIPPNPPEVVERGVTALGSGLAARVRWNQPILPMGERAAVIVCGDREYHAPLWKRSDDSSELCFWAAKLRENAADCQVRIPDGLEIYTFRGVRWTEPDRAAP